LLACYPHFIQQLLEAQDILHNSANSRACTGMVSGKFVLLQRLQVRNADTRNFKDFFKRELLRLTLCSEFLTDRLSHDKRSNPGDKRNITSSPSNGYELVMS
jgi:hypothetical protein